LIACWTYNQRESHSCIMIDEYVISNLLFCG
jgi:hypothetical protein